MPRLFTATDIITDRENVERVLKRHSAGSYFFLVSDAAHALSLCRSVRGATIKTFSSENQMKLTACLGYLFNSCFAYTSHDNLLVSVKSWAHFFSKHFSFKSFWMMSNTNDLEISVSCAIWQTVWWVPGRLSWLNTSSSIRRMLSVVLPPTAKLPFDDAICVSLSQRFFKPDSLRGWLGRIFQLSTLSPTSAL